jgi:hypothetical protein
LLCKPYTTARLPEGLDCTLSHNHTHTHTRARVCVRRLQPTTLQSLTRASFCVFIHFVFFDARKRIILSPQCRFSPRGHYPEYSTAPSKRRFANRCRMGGLEYKSACNTYAPRRGLSRYQLCCATGALVLRLEVSYAQAPSGTSKTL